MKALRYLNKYLLKYKYRFFFGILFIILSNLFGVIQGPIIRKVIDDLTTSYAQYQHISEPGQKEIFKKAFIHSTMIYGLLILGMTIISGVFLYLVRQMIIAMSRLVEFDLKNEIYAHYQTLPLSFYRKNNTGDLMSRISEDVSQVRMYLGPSIMYFLNLVSLFVICMVIMFWVNVKLATFVLIPLPILAVCIYFVTNVMDKRSSEIQKGIAGLSTFVQEAFSGIRVIKAFAREEDIARQFETESKNYRQKSLNLALVNAFFFPLIMLLTGLSVIIIVYLGGIEKIHGDVSYGNITEFIFYLNKLAWPVASLGWTTSLVQRAEASQRRINEFLHTKTDLVSTHGKDIAIEGDIVFDHVSFTYPDSGIQALKDVSFHIAKGEALAIVGTTGSGKSTIANLLCRMYDPASGQILIDNANIKIYDIFSLRSQIGYVPQDVFLFSDTIRNNISFGTEYMEETQIHQAAKDADLYDNIVGFPDQFETILGERGITLSGGQKQRLSIARAISRKPKILILDDSLSAVDTKTENAILNSLQGIMEGKTSLIISHRVSSVKLADRIIVLDEGKIVESGTHESLMAAEGTYKSLYNKQQVEQEKGSDILKS